MNAESRGSIGRIDALIIGALLLVSATAFIRLLSLPAFEDEGTELRWIFRALEHGEWLNPLSDGKPLQVWLMTLWIALGFHPLTTMRAVNVLSGMITVMLTYRLALRAENRAVAAIAGLLIAICPFTIYLQRLALSESFLCAAGLWALSNTVRFLDAPTRTRALWLGASLVAAAFSKFPVGFVFAVALPFALAFMPAAERAILLNRTARTEALIALTPVILLGAAVLAIAIIQVEHGQLPGFGLKLLFGIAGGKFQDVTESIDIPPLSLVGELTAQLSWPVAIVGAIGLLLAVWRGDWRIRWLIAMGGIPLLAIGGLADFWYPRYLLFALPPLCIAATMGWNSLLGVTSRLRPAIYSALALTVVLLARQSALLILDPPAARWSPLDRFQYFEGWSSGYGYPDAAQWLQDSTTAPEFLFALDGHSAYQLQSYLPAEWRRRIRTVIYAADGRLLPAGDARLANLTVSNAVWIVIAVQLLPGYLESNFGTDAAARISTRKIVEFAKPGTRSQLAIYELTLRDRAAPGS